MDELHVKIIITGERGIGLSTLIKNYFKKLYSEDSIYTIGVDFYGKRLLYNEIDIVIQLWRLSAEVRFKLTRSSWLNGSYGIILMYDLTDPKSLKHIPEWIELLRDMKLTIPIMMLGNKVDLINKRQIFKEDIDYLFDKFNITLSHEISAESGINIDDAFNDLLKIIRNDVIL
jgi:small GTP-binding protein